MISVIDEVDNELFETSMLPESNEYDSKTNSFVRDKLDKSSIDN